MMNMLIQLDEKKIIEDGKYDLHELWNFIDNLFEMGCTKIKQANGCVLYAGNFDRNYYSTITMAYIALKYQEWMARYCVRWIWYDNDDNENLPFQELDVLANQKKENPLFF